MRLPLSNKSRMWVAICKAGLKIEGQEKTEDGHYTLHVRRNDGFLFYVTPEGKQMVSVAFEGVREPQDRGYEAWGKDYFGYLTAISGMLEYQPKYQVPTPRKPTKIELLNEYISKELEELEHNIRAGHPTSVALGKQLNEIREIMQ